ncbi:hypothetical protein ACFOPX_06645 [Helicobacter baculiformis]|uniref:Uncharacterized protein n=1 Tax=Helicobacter baculiformis TaxID=427351 RepID=A0ABV7ZI39_9HELI|nr:hypothetical protein [Helicobacter baculiformis]
MGILHNGQLSKEFYTDAIVSIEVKNNLLVVSEGSEGFVDDHHYKDQYAFEMLGGRFYLKTYGIKVFFCHDSDPQGYPEGCPVGDGINLALDSVDSVFLGQGGTR